MTDRPEKTATSISSHAPDDPCPICGIPLARRPGMFFWRGTFSDGVVCAGCNSLWPITGEEMEPLRAQSDKDAPADV